MANNHKRLVEALQLIYFCQPCTEGHETCYVYLNNKGAKLYRLLRQTGHV